KNIGAALSQRDTCFQPVRWPSRLQPNAEGPRLSSLTRLQSQCGNDRACRRSVLALRWFHIWFSTTHKNHRCCRRGAWEKQLSHVADGRTPTSLPCRGEAGPGLRDSSQGAI